MQQSATTWDYLIVTASNTEQAEAYEAQLKLRENLGLLPGIRRTLVVADPEGKRVGSGGSTIFSLLAVLNRELAGIGSGDKGSRQAWLETLSRLRILLIHAGGDSRRLPAYAPCGKVFIPVPGETDRVLTTTLFDRQLPTYLGLPLNPTPGQVVITSGDVLLTFDPSRVVFKPGVTGLGCYAAPADAAGHGVYCSAPGGKVRWYLQKPTVEEQEAMGAIDRYGRAILDIGVLSLDAETTAKLLCACGAAPNEAGQLEIAEFWRQSMLHHGIDFYREVCCAMGAQTAFELYRRSAHASGSSLDELSLRDLYATLSGIPFHVQVLHHCSFLHFGTSGQLIDSGMELIRRDRGVSQLHSCLSINNRMGSEGGLLGSSAWVESCRVNAALSLGGGNLVTGLDIDEPVSLGPGDCVDAVPGTTGDGRRVWFVRCYSVSDSFKGSGAADSSFCDRPLLQWLSQVGASEDDVWPSDLAPHGRSVWNAALFPEESSPAGFRQWLWMLHPETAAVTQKEEWHTAKRYSLAEMANLTDFQAFYNRRSELRLEEILGSITACFGRESNFSARELVLALQRTGNPADWVCRILSEAHWHSGAPSSQDGDFFTFSRLMHTLGSAISTLVTSADQMLETLLPGLRAGLDEQEAAWLDVLGLLPNAGTQAAEWASALCNAAFEHLESTIIHTGVEKGAPPRNALRSDEIVWGRAPARLDLGGGWTDTPPYSLENGGSVLNAAVHLNGQPPIQCYARVIDTPVIRIGSIDLGTRVEISALDSLLNYRQPGSEFALAKAALALCGFDPQVAEWKTSSSLPEMLKAFGGGIELTTLAAIPKGSGLGTSSIMGAVVLSAINRMIGRRLSRRELFHAVLRLEQALTTGGGWQDQVGGAVEGVKLIDSEAGLVPDIRIHFVPPDVLDPVSNGGRTLLYYTGITRLAKDILHDVVGRYLDRDRSAMWTLHRLHRLGASVAEAMSGKDLVAFGRLIDVGWKLNNQLDPHSTNEEIESLLSRLSPHLLGAKLLGAGGGGFLLMVCRTAEDAHRVRSLLESEPPNPRARFFDFSISSEGLVVSVC